MLLLGPRLQAADTATPVRAYIMKQAYQPCARKKLLLANANDPPPCWRGNLSPSLSSRTPPNAFTASPPLCNHLPNIQFGITCQSITHFGTREEDQSNIQYTGLFKVLVRICTIRINITKYTALSKHLCSVRFSQQTGSPPRLWPLTDCTINYRPVLSSKRAPQDEGQSNFPAKETKR
jgi:hypothetical protein